MEFCVRGNFNSFKDCDPDIVKKYLNKKVIQILDFSLDIYLDDEINPPQYFDYGDFPRRYFNTTDLSVIASFKLCELKRETIVNLNITFKEIFNEKIKQMNDIEKVNYINYYIKDLRQISKSFMPEERFFVLPELFESAYDKETDFVNLINLLIPAVDLFDFLNLELDYYKNVKEKEEKVKKNLNNSNQPQNKNLKLEENFTAFKNCCKALEEQSLIEYVKFIRDLHERLVEIFNNGWLTETVYIIEFDDIKDLCYPIVDEDCWPPPDNNMKFIEIFNFVKSEINSFNEPNFQERINEYFKIFNKENNFPIIKEYAVIYEDKIEWHGKCQDLAYCLSNAIG